VWDANKNGANLLKDALSFPIGLTMKAEHIDEDDIAY